MVLLFTIYNVLFTIGLGVLWVALKEIDCQYDLPGVFGVQAALEQAVHVLRDNLTFCRLYVIRHPCSPYLLSPSYMIFALLKVFFSVKTTRMVV